MMSPPLSRHLLALMALCALVLLPAAGASAQDGLPDAKRLDRWQFLPDPADAGCGPGLAEPGGGAGGLARRHAAPRLRGRARSKPSSAARSAGTARRSTPAAPARLRLGRCASSRSAAPPRLAQRPARSGTHRDPYVPFTLPLDGLRARAARTRSSCASTTARASEPREGWWNWGGITRPASLVPLGRAVLHDPGADAERRVPGRPGAARAKVLVDGEVENRTAEPLAPHVAVVADRARRRAGRPAAR